jgi:hypothetical protein
VNIEINLCVLLCISGPLFNYLKFTDDILSRPSSDLCVEGYADAAEAVIGRGCYLARTACPVPVRVRVVIPAYYRFKPKFI